MKCFYHNDPDGWCSAAIVRKYCEENNIQFTREDFIEVSYDNQLLSDKVSQGEQVFMVDFSVDPEQMILIHCNTDFTWIDHHVSAINKMEQYKDAYPIKGLRDENFAGCALTYFYLYEKEPDIQSLPEVVKLVNLWDTWQWKKLDTLTAIEVEAFITSLLSDVLNNDPTSALWDCLFDVGTKMLDECVDDGICMLSFRDGYAESTLAQFGKLIDFEGYKCYACNIPKCNIEWFKSVETICDIMMPFYYNMNTGLFTISLYTNNPDIDVSKITEKYGGGGHKGAAGFQLKILPWMC